MSWTLRLLHIHLSRVERNRDRERECPHPPLGTIANQDDKMRGKYPRVNKKEDVAEQEARREEWGVKAQHGGRKDGGGGGFRVALGGYESFKKKR